MNKNLRKISIIAMIIVIFSIIPTKFVHALENKNIDITAKTNVTKEDAKEWAYRENATNSFIDLVDLYWDLYKDHGNINPAIAFIQAGAENNFGNDNNFNEEYKNSSLMNALAEPLFRAEDNREPYRFKSWRDGVIAHLDHLALYAGVKGYPKKANGTTDPNHSKELYGKSSKLSDVLKKWLDDDGYIEFVSERYNNLCEFAKTRKKAKMNLESVAIMGNELNIRGWAIHGVGIEYINVSLDGRDLGQIHTDIERADVARAFPEYRDSNLSGFANNFDIREFTKGNKELKLEVFANDGSKMVQTKTVVIEKKKPRMNLEKAWVNGNTLNIKGWALNGSQVLEIKAYLNDEYVGHANLGIRRPDVNKAFPNYPDGDISGFNGRFEVGYIYPGEKTLKVEVRGGDNTIITRTTKVNLQRKPGKMNLETPKAGVTINNGILDIRGWALYGSEIKDIKIYANDKFLGYAKTEIERPDVNRVFPGYPNGDKSGFTARFNTDEIGYGEKVIKAEVNCFDGTKIIRTAKINLKEKAARINLEYPENNLTSNGVKLKVKGWALNASDIKEVKLYVDNEFLGNATVNQKRDDVARVFSAYKDAKNSGFTGEFNVSKFSAGNHKVKAVAIGKNGTSKFMEKTIKFNKKVIVIDPDYNIKSKNNIDLGEKFIHNGKEYKSSEVNMELAVKLKEQLSNFGYKVLLTQEPSEINNDKTEDDNLNRRRKFTENSKADMFIRIESNGNRDAKVNGVKAYYSTSGKERIESNAVKKSKFSATILSENIANVGGFVNNGIEENNQYLLRVFNIPSISIVPGTLSNAEDAEKITNKNNQIKIATDMAKKINECFTVF
ncbi:N-acetylmuramoyl-L-alanine amidase [Clostridium tarantellae]|uniref:MurNAc-LAA domain-containing protein n=1 Tax=Clostridium tarantellae TaxID=39493 RepID=A0A6I1MUT2_9CLOT|nr:N-acetylmuramoyl-L-alanine amidase [Clostridium tarantellae]MPQ43969.1 hypothetical protein [Clostridium tarantellae]